MRRDTRYRFITLGVGVGILAAVFVFLALVQIAADAHQDLDQLPAPVLEEKVLRAPHRRHSAIADSTSSNRSDVTITASSAWGKRS